MIVKQVAAGAKTAGLLAYLYGPGVGEARGGTVHVNPRTVASWDGQPSVHSPKQLASGRRSVGGLARSLDAPVALVTKAPAKHVGHIVVANHPDDPILTDAQWRQIAADVMRRSGLSKGPQDADAVRWIAVRHDDTSIHIAYTKVRESGRAAGYVNYTRAWESMRHEWEERLGLVPTGKADGTARRPYGQAESARTKTAQRTGNLDARPDTAELRQLCRAVALEVRDLDTYFSRLRSAGLTITEERDDGGALTGYRAGLRSRADGALVLYASGRLDPALDVDALVARWGADGAPKTSSITEALPDPGGVPNANAADRYATDVEDVLRRAACLTGDRAYFDAAETYGPANRRSSTFLRQEDGPRSLAAHSARQLGSISALLHRFAKLNPVARRQVEAAELAVAIASLLAERAAWHETNGDRAGARAATSAAKTLLASTERSVGGRKGGPLGTPGSQVGTQDVSATAPTRLSYRTGKPQSVSR